MAQRRPQRWFAVKTLYRVTAAGRPMFRDRYYDQDATLAEERVVLLRATGFDDAIRQAEREARRYSSRTVVNRYGQKVRIRYLGACNAFDPQVEEIMPGSEVFSLTELRPADISDRVIVQEKLGRPERSRRRRDKFVDGDLLLRAYAAIGMKVQGASALRAARLKPRAG